MPAKDRFSDDWRIVRIAGLMLMVGDVDWPNDDVAEPDADGEESR